MKARVYKSTGSWYLVKDTEGVMHQARIAGKLKLDQLSSTNPVAVGDWVNIQNEEDAGSIIITEIYKRNNYIIRSSPHSKHQHHIIAANLDQSLLLVTIKDPKTSTGFIDRFLITSEAYHIPAILVFNKIDLLKERDLEKLEQIRNVYINAGYQVLNISLKEKQGLDILNSLLHDKVTLLSGHSGVGKSTFINELFPDFKLRTQDVSDWSGKGMHTTTFAEMFDLPVVGQIIDTPGIRELGLVDIERQELAHYFPEMRKLMNGCQFNNCLHVNEPGCAIKKAVDLMDNSIDEVRYFSYLNLLEQIQDKSY